MKEAAEVCGDYGVLMERLDEFLVDQKDNQDIGEGVAAVVCIRMSAMICAGLGDLTKEEFLEFAENHWDKSVVCIADERLKIMN